MSSLSFLLFTLSFPTLIEIDEVTIANDTLQVADVVEFGEEGSASKDLVGAFVLDTIQGTRQEKTYTAVQLQSIIRRRVPGLKVIDTLQRPARKITIKISRTAEKALPISAICYSARKAISAGDVITHEMTTRTECSSPKSSYPVYYDRLAGVVRARKEVSFGEPLGRITPANNDFVDHGTNLYYKIYVGPVLIERKVTSIQSGYIGQPVFARSNDGTILKSTLLEEATK